MKNLAILVFLMTVVGCATTWEKDFVWHKDNGTPAQFDHAKTICLVRARQARVEGEELERFFDQCLRGEGWEERLADDDNIFADKEKPKEKSTEETTQQSCPPVGDIDDVTDKLEKNHVDPLLRVHLLLIQLLTQSSDKGNEGITVKLTDLTDILHYFTISPDFQKILKRTPKNKGVKK